MGKLWKILVVVFIVVCILFPAFAPAIAGWLTTAGYPLLAGVVTALGALPWWVMGAVGLGLAYTADPATTSEIINDVAELGSNLVTGIVDVVSTGAGALLSNILPIALLFGAFLMLKKKDTDKPDHDVVSRQDVKQPQIGGPPNALA